jgi:hypothetical protein
VITEKFITIPIIITILQEMYMENNNKYVSIPVKPDTKERFDKLCPKAYSYDEMVSSLLDMFENTKKSGVRTGKSAQDSQTS